MNVSQKTPTIGLMKEEAAHLERRAREEENSHRSEMIWNYLHHHALEFCARAEDIFAPELTIANPHYETTLGTEGLVTLDGKKEIISEFYNDLDGLVSFEIDNTLFVKDGGLLSNSTVVYMEDGERLLNAGFDVDDPNATYERRFPIVQFWEYDADAKLIGERLWQGGAFKISKLDPSEVVTFDEQVSVWENYFPEETNVPPSSLTV